MAMSPEAQKAYDDNLVKVKEYIDKMMDGKKFQIAGITCYCKDMRWYICNNKGGAEIEYERILNYFNLAMLTGKEIKEVK